MKVWYVVPVFVFLYYMSVEYIAQVLEKLAALYEGLEYVGSETVWFI